jgi:hypothetical protein
MIGATARQEMMMGRVASFLVIGAVTSLIAFVPGAIFAQVPNKPLPAPEKPLTPEKNPPGDIPDNQAFVEYHSPLGFSIEVPEGWARRQTSEGVKFSDKYNTIALAVSQRAEPLSVTSTKQQQIDELEKAGKAVRVSAIKSVKLPSGAAVVVSYGSNSEPNPVTNKAIRLENDRYFLWKNGKLVTLTLSAPLGADNADQWQLMAKSFRWQ